jgi:homoserine O-succinyltransferase
MTFVFDSTRSIQSPALAPSRTDATKARVLQIGLINNMPDSALVATERQFARLLQAAAGEIDIRLHCFSLLSIERGAAAQARIDAHYADIAELPRLGLDALIVTGAEPRAASLRDEPFWRALSGIVDWAEQNTRSTIWSCLAAHAAVLHLDGIERRRLPEKCSGIYQSATVGGDWLLDGLHQIKVPHSRLNDLCIDDLVARGYQLLTHSPMAGIDIFARRGQSQFIFFQGHPEYDALSLQREFVRDVGRYLAGERDDFPATPLDYFDVGTEAELAAFQSRAAARPQPALLKSLPQLSLRADAAVEPEQAAILIFRNWLRFLSGHKGEVVTDATGAQR